MRPSPILVVLLAAGCGPVQPDVSTAPTSATGEPAPYIFDEDDPPVPGLQAAELEVVIESAVALVLSLNAGPIFPAYDTAMAGAEETCPAYYTSEGSRYWYDSCTASTGATYSGYSFYQLYDDFDAGDGALYDGRTVSGVAQIVTADGYTYESGGTAQSLEAVGVGYTYFSSYIAGGFSWDGPEAAGTWLETGVSPDITLLGYVAPGYGNYMLLDGGLSGLGGLDAALLDTVVFDSVLLFDAGLGSSCPTEPGGVVSVRDDVGNWYDVVFDGPTDSGVVSDPDLCDGCGSAWFRGEPLGEVCVDFGGLLEWEVSPW